MIVSEDELPLIVGRAAWMLLQAMRERAERLAAWAPNRATLDSSGCAGRAPSRRRARRHRAKARAAA